MRGREGEEECQGTGAEPRALKSAGVLWRPWAKGEGVFGGLLENRGGRRAWALPPSGDPSTHLSPCEGQLDLDKCKATPPSSWALRLSALPSKPSLHHARASGLHMDVQVPRQHLSPPPSQLPLPMASGPGARSLCLCAHTCPRLHTLPVCTGYVSVHACLVGGLPLPPVKAMLRFLSFVLTTSLYVGKLIWALGEGQCLQDSHPGRMSKDAGAPMLPFLRLGQVGSLNLARNIPEESVN